MLWIWEMIIMYPSFFFLKKLSINLEFPVFISDKRSIWREFELNHLKVIKQLLLFVLFYY